jgi:hypothetical protein
MAWQPLIPSEFRTRVEQWLEQAVTSVDDIKRLVDATGVNQAYVDPTGSPAVRWSNALPRIVMENRFHLLLNALANYAPNAESSAKIQEFSIEYDIFVANGVLASASDLQKELEDLIDVDQPQALAAAAAKIRKAVRVIRAQIDDNEFWINLPFTKSGYAAADARDELSANCLRVVQAADGLIHETRILGYIGDDALTEDPDTSVRRQRLQLAAVRQAKVALAQRGRTLLMAARSKNESALDG